MVFRYKYAVFLLLILILVLVIPYFLMEWSKIKSGHVTSVMNNADGKYIRNAAVAGSFYDADKVILDRKLQNLLDNVKPKDISQSPVILIVPHAGLMYSGNTASHGFKSLIGKNITKVILMGVSHTTYMDYIAVSPKGIWKTPLGEAETDNDLTDFAVYQNNLFRVDAGPHIGEHSLEMELIFLQKTLGNFKILPLIFGQLTQSQLDRAAGIISEMIDGQTLLVVSSDLSHYPDWDTANKADKETINAILTGDPDGFRKKLKSLESAGFADLKTAACGQDAIYVALQISKMLGVKKIDLLHYENSGDITGDQTRVVGYGGISFFKGPDYQLPQTVKKEALDIARQSITDYLKGKASKPAESTADYLNSKRGVFVTLNLNGQLRGCIGQFEPSNPLWKTIGEVAVESASQDPRFNPVTRDELDQIDIEISILSTPKKISGLPEIIPGKHGVIIESAGRKATFLPQVATDMNWDRTELLKHLCSEKAGLDENCYLDPATGISIYTAIVFSQNTIR